MIRQLKLTLAIAFLAFSSGFSWASDRPNLILIMADDFGYELVGANGGHSYRTPQLDELAATGMRFEHCYVQPLCTPTRVQLMTGQYNVRNYTEFGRIDRDATTFAHVLKNAGYATAIAGKWQLGLSRNLPQRLGFDESCLWQHTRRPPRYANPGLEYNGVERDFEDGEYGPKLVNDFAIDFITRHKEGPFLLYYPMMLTHRPFEPTPDSADWDPKASGPEADRDVKYFADMVEYMDKMIGRLVEKLDELEIRDNTLVIFLGDNGTDRSVTSQFKGLPYQGGKGLGNSRGMHVPLIVNWPGRVSGGRVNADLIDSSDFLPTLCEAAGAELPKPLPIDGRSFFPQLMGQTGQPRDWIYCWYARHGGPTAKIEFAMSREYKLYRDGTFFNLGSDPFEERPLRAIDGAGDARDAAVLLQAALDQYKNARPAHLREAPVRARRRDR
jgi:arylsulfatase A